MRGFSRCIPAFSPVEAEAIALHEGLMLCWELGVCRREVECDSKEVVNAIKDQKPVHGCAWILQKIIDLMNQDWSVKLVHGGRESNSCADMLAKLGRIRKITSCNWTHPPMEVVDIIRIESEGSNPLDE